MLKTQATLEIEQNGRNYILQMPSDSPLGEVHDILFKMRFYVIEKINEIANAEKDKFIPVDKTVDASDEKAINE
jgi:hypothetical protein